ncbi:MAG: DNA translocase FtsK 4TM domain-containing protein [Pseudomonadota bacterium]
MPQAHDNSGASSRMREGLLIGLGAACAYLVISLLSYSDSDPGWSATGSGDAIQNLGGPTGAWLADASFSLVGFLAYLFPLMLAYRVAVLFSEREKPTSFSSAALSLRVVGLILVMASGTALAYLNHGGGGSLPQGAGGIVGQAVGLAVRDAFSAFGGRLLLVAVFLFGITIFTDLSWLRMMDRLGALALAIFDSSSRFLVRFWDDRKDKLERERQLEARKQVIEHHVEKEKKRTPPKIKPLKKPPEVSDRAERERQVPLFDAPVSGELPALDLLDVQTRDPDLGYSPEALEKISKLLELKLADFGVTAEVTAVYPGPVITRFEIQPAPGVKVSRISNLAKDLARSLAVISVRVVEVIPGKSVVGIEIPNEHREIVNFREVLASRAFDKSPSALSIALGHDISGQPIVADLARMPHLLVAGTTGSGKSVGVNAMLLSLLYKSTPQDVRMILVDPKMLELSVYDGIPHLLTPVITDMKDAANGLRWCVAEMERRYKLMAALGVRNLAGFNRKVADAIKAEKPLEDPLWAPDPLSMTPVDEQTCPTLEALPAIVVVIDEFADMMMIVGKKVEELIARIAQKARAAGIHLILATQRPSVDVITGLIKANIPTRIAFQVSSKVDSRTILDQGGAEQLLGHGDMLYLPPGSGLPTRVHGAFVSDDEVHRVVADWKRRGEPTYIEGLLDEGSSTPVTAAELQSGTSEEDNESDALYDEAVHYVTQSRRASISSVQRKLRIGYNRAARLIEAMEAAGVVSEMQTNGQREVLAPPPVEG